MIQEAIMVVAGLGEAVIPTLIQNLEMGDVKAQMAMASALGWMGAKAVDPLPPSTRRLAPTRRAGPSCSTH